MPEQAPLRTQRLNKPAQQRSQAEWDDDEPTDQALREIGGAHHLSVAAGQTGDGESQIRNESTDPADGESDMRGERELAEEVS